MILDSGYIFPAIIDIASVGVFSYFVIPAEAGIYQGKILDPRFRGDDRKDAPVAQWIEWKPPKL